MTVQAFQKDLHAVTFSDLTQMNGRQKYHGSSASAQNHSKKKGGDRMKGQSNIGNLYQDQNCKPTE